MPAAKNEIDSVMWQAEGGKINKNKEPTSGDSTGLKRYSNDYVS
jgi:hypothetical protein